MKHLFVPYALAKLLKEKGFNEPCFTFFYPYDGDFRLNAETMPRTWWKNAFFSEEVWAASTHKQKDKDFMQNVAAPLYQQVIDWFREKHNLAVLIAIPFDVFWTYSINGINGNGYYSDSSYKDKKDFADYYEALTTAIEEALKIIP